MIGIRVASGSLTADPDPAAGRIRVSAKSGESGLARVHLDQASILRGGQVHVLQWNHLGLGEHAVAEPQRQEQRDPM